MTTENYPNIPLSGLLPYTLTNDYLFRAFFQENPIALEGLCRAVLRLEPEDTITVKLNNPIVLGAEIEDKEFILDLSVTINNNRFLNLEMQAYYDPYWPERALSYTCRSYDNLEKGEDYSNTIPVHQVGFLNFTLFPEEPRFFSEYQLVNISKLNDELAQYQNTSQASISDSDRLQTNPNIARKKNPPNVPIPQIFSSKFSISVIDLNHIELATAEDKKYGIDLWAQLFKANRWEDIRMLSQKNEYMKQSVVTIAQLTEEEQIRMRCQARKSNEYWERMRNEYYHKKDIEYEAKDKEFAVKEIEFAAKEREFAAKDKEFAAKDKEFAAKDKEFAAKEKEFAAKDKEFTAKEAKFSEMTAIFEEKIALFQQLLPEGQEKDSLLADLQKELNNLKNL